MHIAVEVMVDSGGSWILRCGRACVPCAELEKEEGGRRFRWQNVTFWLPDWMAQSAMVRNHRAGPGHSYRWRCPAISCTLRGH